MPSYHIVAADSRSARTGKFLEVVGRYEPMRDPGLVNTKEERLFYWLGKGALPTDTVRSLLRKNGSWMKWALTKKGTDPAIIAAEMEKWQMLQTAKLQREDERKARRLATKRKAKKAGASESPAPAPAAPAEQAPA